MVQGIIMAGGEGSRLRPLTCDRPKPVVPVLNRPVMEYAVELLKKHGVDDIGVTLQYMPQEIKKYFDDGSDIGVSFHYFIEETPLGTAGSVKNAQGFLKDTFVVVSGDALTDFNLSEAIDFHRSKGALATLVLTPVEIPLEYGVVITGEDGGIRQFLEKPGWGEVFSDTVNTGIYILEPEVLDYIPAGQKFDFSQDLFPLLLKEGKPLFGVILRGYWCDIGNLKQYQEAQYAAMEGRVSLNIRGSLRGDKIYAGENCKIDPTAVITGPVVIGSGCHIGRHSAVGPDVVLGDNCKIDDNASLKRAVIWSGTYIGKHAEIRGAVLCSKVTVKDRAAVFEGAVIGDGGILEEDVKIRPNTKIWPYKLVEKGTSLDNHLIWGTKACRSFFGTDGVAGGVNINLTPECAVKLGAAFGAVSGAGSTVLVSSDHHRCTHMIKTAVQLGLMSTGIAAIDGGTLVTPVHRNAVRALGVKAGVHVKSAPNDPERIHINFFNGNGTAVSRDLERKIENQFERADFQRHSKNDIGTVSYMPALTESYIQNLFQLINPDIIRSRRFRVVAYFAGDSLQMLIPYVFNGLGCELINMGPVTGDDTAMEMTSMAEAIAGEVTRTGANLGIVFDSNAENVVIIDDSGRVIGEDLFLALMSLIILETSQRPVVAVPVTGSGVVETIAGTRQGSVIRTKTAPAAFMNDTMKPEVVSAQGPFGQAAITYDALSTAVRVMEYIAQKDVTLTEVVDGIPEFYMTRKQTECPWMAKGKVMRQLIDETRGRHVELLDGIKVYHENGWALVLPDAGEPQYHVYSEGYSYEFAEELANFYIERINQLRQ